ncbi:unnamed protein product [Haemonchus placei]|uniref:Uncharacterized protein n=1 Tax=Haemonchus placei TaxID=6290 RepID=A0A0N4W4E0_HAEPC|nr:unnamed protein product [Haemonchus placei]
MGRRSHRARAKKASQGTVPPPATVNSPVVQMMPSVQFVARQLSEIPPRILEEFAPECSYDSIVAIVNSHRLILLSLDNAVKFMEECLVTFKGVHWFKGNYVYLAAWRAELFHCLTAITVHREVLQEEIFPHFFDNNVDRDEFCTALELQKVSVDTLLPLLRRTSAICAHLTRLIRWIEFHQQALLHDHRDADPEAVNLMTCYGMGIMSSYEEDSVPEYLEWWRKKYDQEYRSNKRFRRLTVERVEQIIVESVPLQSAEASNVGPGRPSLSREASDLKIPNPPRVDYSNRSRHLHLDIPHNNRQLLLDPSMALLSL